MTTVAIQHLILFFPFVFSMAQHFARESDYFATATKGPVFLQLLQKGCGWVSAQTKIWYLLLLARKGFPRGQMLVGWWHQWWLPLLSTSWRPRWSDHLQWVQSESQRLEKQLFKIRVFYFFQIHALENELELNEYEQDGWKGG